MIYKSEGIVLHSMKYGESSLISKIYTKDFGLISLLAHSVRKTKSQNKSALFQIFSQVEVVFHQKSKENLAILKEIKIQKHYQTIHTDMLKLSVSIFLSEIILKAVREEEQNIALFNFIQKSMLEFDEKTVGTPNFHLQFLVNFAYFLGIVPQNNYSLANRIFDLEAGMFVATFPSHYYFLDEENSELLSRFLTINSLNSAEIEINRQNRKTLLLAFIDYFKIHLSGFGNIQSLHVLEEVFK